MPISNDALNPTHTHTVVNVVAVVAAVVEVVQVFVELDHKG